MITAEQIKALAQIEDFSDRLEAASMLVTGNIVEIGGGEGVNTIRFLRMARERKSMVIVVDPFEQIDGADESYFKPYSIKNFLGNVGYGNNYVAYHLCLIQLPSQHEWMQHKLSKSLPIGFMFIDGLQDKASVLSDLKLAESLNAELICVDDYDRLTESSQVPLSVNEFLKTTKYKFIDIGKREAYFIK